MTQHVPEHNFRCMKKMQGKGPRREDGKGRPVVAVHRTVSSVEVLWGRKCHGGGRS